MTDTPFMRTKALQDFRRARQRASLEVILSRLSGSSVELLSYDEAQKKLKASAQAPPQLQEISIDAIVGSAGRYSDFTRSFLPRHESGKDRWARVQSAVSSPTGVPPIEVYQIGDAYFVRDGHHRISVARQLGARQIEAYVTPVKTRVGLSSDADPEELILKAEYTEFLERTRLDEQRPDADLTLTCSGGYSVLLDQIGHHHRALQTEWAREMSFDEAAREWYDEVYLPIVHVIRQQGILRDFPNRTEADLYLWIHRHQAEIHSELGWEVEVQRAAADLTAKRSPKPERVASRLGERLASAVIPDALEGGPPPGAYLRKRLQEPVGDRLVEDLLVGIDGEPQGWEALDQSIQIAERDGARIIGLHVVAPDQEPADASIAELTRIFDDRCRAGGVTGKLTIEPGSPPDRLSDRARWTDLVVVPLSHPPADRPLERLTSGFRTLLYRCPRPVLAVPGPASRLECALVAYDGGPKSREALYIAAYMAEMWKPRVTILTVEESGKSSARVLADAENYLRDRGVSANYVLEKGPAVETIGGTAKASGSDLILMGGYGASPVVEIVLGSVLDGVLRSSNIPILVCR